MPQHSVTLFSPKSRVKLVPPNAADDEAVSIIRSHPETLRYLRFFPTNVSAKDARIRREARAEDPRIIDFHIHTINDDGSYSFGGMTGIFNVDETQESCEVGILVSPNRHRGGYGTHALYTILKWVFEDRKMHRATFETGEDNLPMRSWLENVLEATLEANRRECWKEAGGKYSNVYGYSILEWEWTGRIKAKLEKLLSRP